MKEAPEFEPMLLKVKEVARLLSASEAKIYDMVKHHDIPYVRLGKGGNLTRGAVRIPYEQFMQWMQSRVIPVIDAQPTAETEPVEPVASGTD